MDTSTNIAPLAQLDRASGYEPEGRERSPQELAYRRNYQRNWIRRRRANFLTGKTCIQCGSYERLELHHRDPRTKTSHRIWSWSLPRIHAEAAKCDILCHDCHSWISRSRDSWGHERIARRGVNFRTNKNLKRPWNARIKQDGRYHSLGYYATPEEAARAYDAKAIERYGSLARLNFPTRSN